MKKRSILILNLLLLIFVFFTHLLLVRNIIDAIGDVFTGEGRAKNLGYRGFIFSVSTLFPGNGVSSMKVHQIFDWNFIVILVMIFANVILLIIEKE